jgi:uncharacterized protein
MKAIILHGTKSSPEEHWFRWLQSGLEEEFGWEAWVPQLPQPEHPSGRQWAQFVLGNAPFAIDGETVVVGHSSGAVTALLLAQQVKAPFRATFAVGTPRDNNFLQWKANDRLFDLPFDYPAIKAGAGKLIFVHSDDDPYCPLDQAEDLCRHCGGELIILKGQGHFNTEKGPEYREFPKLLDAIIQKVGA